MSVSFFVASLSGQTVEKLVHLVTAGGLCTGGICGFLLFGFLNLSTFLMRACSTAAVYGDCQHHMQVA